MSIFRTKWHNRIRCKFCKKGFDTFGGKLILGFIRKKTWEKVCKCDKTPGIIEQIGLP